MCPVVIFSLVYWAGPSERTNVGLRMPEALKSMQKTLPKAEVLGDGQWQVLIHM